jgi:hypothetical protein
MTTTQLSLNHLRKQGYACAVTETWLQFPERKNGVPTGKMVRIKRDLFMVADLLAFNPMTDEVMLVQTTTTGHQANRVAKIRGLDRSKDSLEIARVARKWLHSTSRRIVVHGWLKSAKSNRWELTVTEIQEEDVVSVPDETETPLFEQVF